MNLEQRLDAVMVELPPEWQPPSLASFAPVAGCEVIAFDPSLSSTGYAWLRVGLRIMVLSKGTLRGKSEKTGYLSTYEKALSIRQQLNGVLARIPLLVDGEPVRMSVAWEAPAVAGYRTESSLIAGYLVYEATGGACEGVILNANHISSVLCGNPRHDKKEVAAAVARYIPESAGRTWNQHERDAAAVGLTHLLDLAYNL